jgi:hypothetical protein
MFNKDTILISVSAIVRVNRGKRQWLVVKKGEEDPWELPRIMVRKTESSARGAMRMAGEQLGITGQILEEVGRSGGVTTVNGRTLSQRQLYYLMIVRDQSGESIGYSESEFLDYAKAVRKLPQKRDRQMLKAAREEFKKWEAKRAKLKDQEEV